MLRKWSLLAFCIAVLTSQTVLAETSKPDTEGRTKSWRKAGQGAPDLKAAKAKVDKNPKNAEALNDYGFALRQNGKLDEAEKFLKQAIVFADGTNLCCRKISLFFLQQRFVPSK